jgi:excisionase family DNA binding protein
MSDPVVLVVADGRVTQLEPAAVDWLRRALLGHFRQLHRNGSNPPSDLVELATAVAASVVDGQHAGRERAPVGASGDAQRVMSYQEAAAQLGVSTRTLRRWRSSGRIRGIGRRLVVDMEEVGDVD